MITSLEDSSISFWNLEDFRVIEKINLPSDSRITKVITHKADPYLIAVGETPIMYFFDLRALPHYHCYQLPNDGSSVLEADIISGQRFVFLGNDNAVYIVDLQRDQRVILRKTIPRKVITSFAMDHKGKYILISVESGEIYLYDCEILIHREISTASNFIELGVPQSMVYPKLQETSVARAERVLSRQSPRNRSRLESQSPGQSPSKTFEALQDSYHKEDRRQRSRSKDFQLVEKKGRESQPIPEAYSSHHFEQERRRYDSQPKRKEEPADFKYSPHTPHTAHDITEEKAYYDPETLKKMLAKKGRFTSRDRTRIWKQLLELPGNRREFEALKARGLHPAYEELYQKYPIRSEELFEKLRKILSCLAHLSPQFAEIEYLPSMIFPFIKIFEEELVCFEVILSFLYQWGHYFLEGYPNPPAKVTNAIEELLKYHAFDLYAFLKERDIELIYILWPSIKNLFTDILLRDDWLALMDFLVYNSQEPSYIIFFLVSYLISFREALKNADDLHDPEFFKKRQNTVNMASILKQVPELARRTPDYLLKIRFRDQLPLTKGFYTRIDLNLKSFEKPSGIQAQIGREKRLMETRGEEMQKISSLTEALAQEEEEYRRNQEITRRREKELRERAIQEEELRLKRKIEAEAEARERRLNQLRSLENQINSSIDTHKHFSNNFSRDLDYEFGQRAKADDREYRSRRELESLRSTDFEAQRRYNQSIEERSKEERARSLKMILDKREHENEVMQKIRQERLKAEEEELTYRINHLRKQREVELRLMEQASEKMKIEYQIRIEELERELRELELERIRKARLAEEEETKRNYEVMRIHKQHEEVLREKEDLQMRRLQEESIALKKAEERIAALEEEKRRQIEETERYKQKLREIEESHRRAEYPKISSETKKEVERRVIEEENKLESLVSSIAKEKEMTREMRDDLEKKQREFEERQALLDAIRENEEKIYEEEKRKFEEFSRALQQEMEKVNEVKRKMTEVKMQELQRQKQELMITHDIELKKKIQAEQMSKYLAEAEEPEVDSLESARQIRGGDNSIHEATDGNI